MRFEPRRRSGRSRGGGGSAECRSNADPRRAKRGVAPSRSTITHRRLGCHYAGGVRKWFPLSRGRAAGRRRTTIRAIGAAGAQDPYKVKVTGSNPVSPTIETAGHRAVRPVVSLFSAVAVPRFHGRSAAVAGSAALAFKPMLPVVSQTERLRPGRPSIANSSSAERRCSTMGRPANRRARRQRHLRARFSMEARRAAFRISHLERRRPLGAQLPTCSSCVRMAFAFDPRWIRGGNAFDPPLLRIGSIGLAGEAAVPSGHDTLARWAPPRLGPAARSE